ncbi:MAG: Crp/Fnr family transcriptional regulator [Bacteroidota bacterium]
MEISGEIRCSSCTEASCAVALLSEPELSEMELHCKQFSLLPGESVLHQGVPFSHVIYLRNGIVKEYLSHPGQQEQIIQLITGKSYLGLPSLFCGEVSKFTYKALTPLDLCYIGQETFRKLILGNGRFAHEIMVSTCRETIQSHLRIIGLNRKQSYGRLADILLYLSDYIFENPTFPLLLNRSELASMTAGSRENISRTLSRFQKEGLIREEGGTMTILNRAKLEEIARMG